MDSIESTKPLSENHLRFIDEYLARLPHNGTAAYQRTYPDATYDAARNAAPQLLKDPRIRAAINARTSQIRETLKMETEDVLREITLIATADPRELTEYYVGACRYCHGIDHKFQRTPAEFARDLEQHIRERAVEKPPRPDPFGVEFDPRGGIGFTQRKEPHVDCPECFGEGVGYEVVKDTRHLSPGAARLYAGVKRTKDGLEIKTLDRAKMVELAGQSLGLFKSKTDVSLNVAPLAAITYTTADPAEAARVYQQMVGGD